MRTWVYIDGFNLYYGAVRGTPYKWLDLVALCNQVLKVDVDKIKYFTAMVNARPDDLNKPRRQETFLQALRTFPQVEVIKGHFLTKKRREVLALDENPKNKDTSKQRVWVVESEEKGSDVNIAVHLLNDAWKNRFDTAIVISNDSDLAEAIRLTQEVRDPENRAFKRVGIINPQIHNGGSKIAAELNKVCRLHYKLTDNELKRCQMPDLIPKTGIKKPLEW